MKYINKSIIGPTGHICNCWRAIRAEIAINNNYGQLTFIGYKDGEALVNSYVYADHKVVNITLSEIVAWSVFHTEFINALCTTGNLFEGGTFATTTFGMQYINKALIGPTGHENTCWKPVNATIDILNESMLLTFAGYKDGDALDNNMIISECKNTTLTVSNLTTWQNLYNNIALVVCSSGQIFEDGSIKDVSKDENGNVIIT